MIDLTDDTSSLPSNNQQSVPSVVESKAQDMLDIEDLANNFNSHSLSSSFTHYEIQEIQSNLIAWYDKERRAMPWRGDAYVVTSKQGKDGDNSKDDSNMKEENDVNGNDVNQSQDQSQESLNGVSGSNIKDLEITMLSLGSDTDTEQCANLHYRWPISAYGVWVSEIMLQQTRVETVIPYWHRWMCRWPTLESLSQATSEEVNSLWAGLGYYRRAQSLLKGAQLVMGVTTPDGDEDGKGGQSMDVDASITTTTADAVTNKKVKAKGKTKSKNSKKIPPSFNNTFPTTLAGLLSLPGVGPYTAGAISSIAYGNRHSIVDGNVIRVLARLRTLHKHHGFLLNNGNKKLETLCWSLADSLVNDVSVPQSFNQGLMELGATICKPSNPDCSKCPIQNVCYARRLMVLPQRIMDQDTTNMIIENEIDNESKCLEESNVVTRPYIDGQPIDPAMFPFKEEKKKIRELVFSVAVLWKDGDGDGDGDGDAKEASLHHRQYLFVKRPSTGLLASQWEFPTVLLYEVPVEAQKAEAEAEAGSGAGKGELNDVDVTKVDKPLEEMVSPTSVSTSTVLWKPFPSYFSSHLGIQGSDALSPGSESPLEEDKKKHLKVFKPISHTFSHQKHYMHVIAQRITFNEAKLLQFDDNNNNTVSWFTASEIEKQGITSGCKKVLQTVMKPSKEKRVASGSASGGGKEGKPKKMKTEAQIEKEKEKEKKKLEKERKQAEKEKEEKKTAPITNFFSKK